MERVRVFLIDDHSVVREGVRMLINAQSDMQVVGEYSQGRGVVEAVKQVEADVVVMDISMPDLSGARATEQLRAETPRTKVIALTRHAERAYVQHMLGAGATGYVLKQSAAELLINAIRSVAGGGTFIDPAVAGKLIDDLASPRKSTVDGSALTAREQEIVTMVALGHTNKEVASTLGISVKTVETHKTNIMQKLELSSRAELVRFAMAQGWLH